MEQQSGAVTPKDKVYRLVRSIYYIIAGIVAALQLYVITALIFVQISCQVYKATLHQVLEGMTFLGTLLIVPLFLYTAIASARRRRWWHFGVIAAIFVVLGIGFFSFAGKSIFYCFLDEMPAIQFYIGPH